jgi:hypothetical protein
VEVAVQEEFFVVQQDMPREMQNGVALVAVRLVNLLLEQFTLVVALCLAVLVAVAVVGQVLVLPLDVVVLVAQINTALEVVRLVGVVLLELLVLF